MIKLLNRKNIRKIQFILLNLPWVQRALKTIKVKFSALYVYKVRKLIYSNIAIFKTSKKLILVFNYQLFLYTFMIKLINKYNINKIIFLFIKRSLEQCANKSFKLVHNSFISILNEIQCLYFIILREYILFYGAHRHVVLLIMAIIYNVILRSSVAYSEWYNPASWLIAEHYPEEATTQEDIQYPSIVVNIAESLLSERDVNPKPNEPMKCPLVITSLAESLLNNPVHTLSNEPIIDSEFLSPAVEAVEAASTDPVDSLDYYHLFNGFRAVTYEGTIIDYLNFCRDNVPNFIFMQNKDELIDELSNLNRLFAKLNDKLGIYEGDPRITDLIHFKTALTVQNHRNYFETQGYVFPSGALEKAYKTTFENYKKLTYNDKQI